MIFLKSFQFRLQSRKSSPPRAPPAVPCKSIRCSHRKIFGYHYDQEEWDDYARLNQEYVWQRQEEETRGREERESDWLFHSLRRGGEERDSDWLFHSLTILFMYMTTHCIDSRYIDTHRHHGIWQACLRQEGDGPAGPDFLIKSLSPQIIHSLLLRLGW